MARALRTLGAEGRGSARGDPYEIGVGDLPAHLAIVGSTASGKSALALELARTVEGIELVSVDSMQVYRGMDIGTAKPTPQEQREVRHHLIDLVEPDEDFTVSLFQAACRAALSDIERRGRRAVLVGGTGLYLRAVIDELAIPGRYPEVRAALEAESDTGLLHARLARIDPLAAARMEPSNRRRILRALEVTIGSGQRFSSFGPGLAAYDDTRFVLAGVSLPLEVIDRRIESRYAEQMERGLLAEVERLLQRPSGLSRTASQALGYKELLAHLRGENSLDAALAEAIRRTRRFARRQRSWFRRDPRITWLAAEDDPTRLLPSLVALLTGHT